MHTFVFVANNTVDSCENLLQYCSQIVAKVIPTLEEDLAKNQTFLPENNCGWFWLEPARTENFRLFSEVIDEMYAVVAFGRVLDSTNPARSILEAWLSGGGHKVHQLEGCFSGVIVDRLKGVFTLISDAIGQRTLRYYTDNQVLVVSPHDIAIVATGCVPVEFDFVSASSMASVHWSLGGKSLLKYVQTCHPSEHIQWEKGVMKSTLIPIIDSKERLAREDTQGIKSNLDQMIETARENLRSLIASSSDSEIKTELSAGFDSRAVLAFLLSTVEPARITAYSVGDHNTLDVRVARQLANMYGLNFSSHTLNAAPCDDFIAHCDLMAFATNGDSSCVDLGTKSLPRFEPSPKLSLCGDGGEISRGRDYLGKDPYAKIPLSATLDSTEALKTLRKKLLTSNLPWRSEDYLNAVKTRLSDSVDRYSTISNDGYDILDMIYLYEKFSVWCSKQERSTWEPLRWSPFSSRKVTNLLYKMPAPIGNYAIIHEESIRRFAPKASLVPINGMTVPTQGEGSLSLLRRNIDRAYLKILREAKQLFMFNNGSRSIQALRSAAIVGPLLEVVREVLTTENSFAIEIFGRNGVELLLNQLVLSRGIKHLDTVSRLISMERWRTMVQAVAEELPKNKLINKNQKFVLEK
jgi:hypothetical protein